MSAKANLDLLLEGVEGSVLTNVTRKGAIAFFVLGFLTELATSGNILSRRQELPSNAFMEVGQWIDALRLARVIALSYGWLSRAHPDPNGFYLKYFGANPRGEKFKTSDTVILIFRDLWNRLLGEEELENMPSCGCFWDFGSLFQVERSAVEETLFREALRAMHHIYAHQCVRVLRFDFVDTRADNSTPYDHRGWPFFETQLSNIKPSFKHPLVSCPGTMVAQVDSSGWVSDRRQVPPMHPDEFDSRVAGKTFASANVDLVAVQGLYRQCFDDSLCKAEQFSVPHGWTDTEIESMIRIIPSLANLRTVDLSYNELADRHEYSPDAAMRLRSICEQWGIEHFCSILDGDPFASPSNL